MQVAFAFLCRKGAKEACAIEPPDLEASLRAMNGEILASRGLALASMGRLEEARSLRPSRLRPPRALRRVF